MNPPVIEMERVAVAGARAPRMAIVRDVNWRVNHGERWVVGGLPGSGKTDLLMTTAGLLPPLEGNHRLFGQSMNTRSEEDLLRTRLRVGLVFADEGRLFAHMTVSENLGLPLCYHTNCSISEAQEKVSAVLDMTGLESMADRRPEEVNRSLRGRVALARAMVLDPELLLLDDPLRGVDTRQSRWWIGFLEELREKRPGLTTVVTTENFRPWVDIWDRFAIIDNRQWTLVGDRTALRSSDEPLLRELLAD